ncbi:MAG: ABC transporter ATP-binding protein [Candidatus Cloacimonetes bacterium]|nr:ABC transporter ATP-binding protein [Candidatus Cloacimonadota bacterium]
MEDYQGFQSDDLKNRKYSDLQLIGKLFRYLLPYKFHLIMSLLLLAAITVIELFTPLVVTKRAIDECIAPNKYLLIFDSQTEMDDFDLKHDYMKIEKYSYKGNFYGVVKNRNIAYLENEFREKIEKDGTLLPDNVYFLDAKKIDQSAFSQNTLFRISDTTVLLTTSAYKSLPTELASIVKKNLIVRIANYGFLFILITIVQLFVTFFQIYTINYAAQHGMFKLRMKLFDHIAKMPVTYFDRNPVGRLVTRVTSDIRTLDELLSNGVITILADFTILFGIIVLMLLLDWRLALVSFSIVPVVFYITVTFRLKVRVAYRELRKKVSALNASLSENISGVKIIQLSTSTNTKPLLLRISIVNTMKLLTGS